jgi:hypothetical protein
MGKSIYTKHGFEPQHMIELRVSERFADRPKDSQFYMHREKKSVREGR